jgi:hypothetical protein
MRLFSLFIPFLRTSKFTPRNEFHSMVQKSPITWKKTNSCQLTTNMVGQRWDDFMEFDPFSISGVIAFSLLIGIASQSFINTMIQGDQGLGAFLSDGDGFSNSKFKGLSQKVTKVDPLPWLKLPKLDFVEVIGQEDDIMERKESDDESMDRLQLVHSLIQQMEKEVDMGDIKGASKTKNYIDSLLRE